MSASPTSPDTRIRSALTTSSLTGCATATPSSSSVSGSRSITPVLIPSNSTGLKKWPDSTALPSRPSNGSSAPAAIGIQSKAGRYGGTYAHLDIALEFASWISVEFKLYLIKEFQRLKEQERQTLGWDIRRNLARINYRIHTDAIQTHLIPPELSKAQTNLVYANEADVLNMALFGQTAAQWRAAHPKDKGNIRDQATGAQLVCLSNLENLNAVFIGEGLSQPQRLARLNKIAIEQMKLLTAVDRTPRLRGGGKGK